MACPDNTYYMDPGSRMCSSCYHVCDRNVDPGLERDCKRFCPEMYKQMKEGNSTPPGAADSVPGTAVETIPPLGIALIVIVCFVAIAVVVGIMLLRRYKSSPCIKGFKANMQGCCCTEVVTEAPTSNGHMPLRQMTQGASVALEERPTRVTGAASSGAAASRTTNATAGTSRNNRTPTTEPLRPSQAASRPEEGSRAPLLCAQGGGSPPRQRARQDPEVLASRISVASSELNLSLHSDGYVEPTQPRGPIASPEDTEGPSARLFS